MTRALRLVSSVLLVAAPLIVATPACRPSHAHPGRSPGIAHHPAARDLHALAEAYRVKHKLPALGIGIVHRGRIVGLGMAGERVAGSGDWATIEDTFDVASCAKSVTATIAARLVERGVVRWDTTLAEGFPELRGHIHPGYAGATLEMLLRHRAGLHHALNRNDRWAAWPREHPNASPAELRRAFTKAALGQPPRTTPGTETFYTSDGYVVAGSLLERAAGTDWAQLVRSLLLDPLELRSMSYRVAAGDGVRQAFGHESGWFGRARPIAPDPAEYGPEPFGAPAGFLRASLPDLLRYVDFHIQGESGPPGENGLRDSTGHGPLLTQASFVRLHRAVGDERFALGWQSEASRDERGRIVEHSVFHGGYSGRTRANLWFSPETQWGTAIVTNHGRGDEAITSDIFYALLRDFQLLPTH